MTICVNCYKKIEYDEGEGNGADGYTCYECIDDKINEKINEKEKDRLMDEIIHNERGNKE